MTDSESLDGRVAIVTGGARGIGAAICRDLARRGAAVIVADSGVGIDGRDPDPSVTQEFADRLDANVHPYTEDLSIPAAAKAVVDLALDKFGAVDILVNNAAILRDASVVNASPDNWDAEIRTNLSAAYYVLGAVTPVLRTQAEAGRGGEGESPVYGWGRVVNIVSTAGLIGRSGQAAYASAKGGLTALTRVAAIDLAQFGVTCNAVAPFARTRVTETIQPVDEVGTTYKERVLRIEPDHVAGLVGYLCSEAARDITGQILGVRGREVFVFSQPRPIATVVAGEDGWTVDSLDAAVKTEFAGKFAELITDWEVFNVDPIL